jgi:hypothetical protein
MQRILIIGATSAIAQAVARLFAEKGNRIFLAGRNPDKISILANDLSLRGAMQVEKGLFEATDFDSHPRLIEESINSLGGLDTVLIAFGTLPDQKKCEGSVEETLREISVNELSILSLLTLLANRFEKQKSGTIAVLSSVAGDRGRKSNYVYGSAKSAVTTFLQGLRNRLSSSGIHIMTIKPGFVDTPMTASFKKGLLWATPESVAKTIIKGIEKKKDVLYTPFFWRAIMIIIRSFPERLFKKMNL